MRANVALILFGLLTVAGTGFARLPESHPPDSFDSWIGWGWLGDAGDLPLRVHLSLSGDEPVAALDSPAHRAVGIPLEVVQWTAPALHLTGTSASGSSISIQGAVEGDRIDGTIRWGGYEGQVELTRSPRRLAAVAPESYANAAGFYERAPGDIVELRTRAWGELLYRELRSGRVRTMLPLDVDLFFLGGGIYLPAPVEAEIRLVRDDAGVVVALSEVSPEGLQRLARKLELVEEPLSFRSKDTTLRGSLLRRSDRPVSPAVVVLGGSSWETRADVAFHTRSLAVLGFAVLSFDRRGHGESEGDPIVPFATTAADAVAAVEELRKRDEIDPARVGVFGMSRGGWQAPLAASISEKVAFLVLLVPPAVSPAEQETRSRLDQMKQEGFSRRAIDLAETLIEATWRWVREGDGWDEYARLRAAAVAAGIPEYVLESDSPEPDKWAWARLNMFFEPCPVLRNVNVHTLAIFAENDLYVSAEINRARLTECIGEQAELAIYTIAGAGHDLSIPNDLPIHRQSGRGDEGFSVLADWAFDTILQVDSM